MGAARNDANDANGSVAVAVVAARFRCGGEVVVVLVMVAADVGIG